MVPGKISDALDLIEREQDVTKKSLLLAGLVSEVFRESGFEPVVVGGAAIEFYTDGAYASGDTDICWTGLRAPNPAERMELMNQIPGARNSGTRSWRVSGLWIDLLGELESYGSLPPSLMDTPTGSVVLLPPEELLVERVFAARRWTGYNEEDNQCARKLMACVLEGVIPFDWAEAERIASLPAYRCGAELQAIKAEVQSELDSERS